MENDIKKKREKDNGAWPSGLRCSVWDAEIVGSNPTAPTRSCRRELAGFTRRRSLWRAKAGVA